MAAGGPQTWALFPPPRPRRPPQFNCFLPSPKPPILSLPRPSKAPLVATMKAAAIFLLAALAGAAQGRKMLQATCPLTGTLDLTDVPSGCGEGGGGRARRLASKLPP